MYLCTTGLPYSDDYLAHYGVLGMKWGKHKAKGYLAKSDVIKRKQDDLYTKARNLRADAEYEKQHHNKVTSKRMKKEAKGLEKSADKLESKIQKLLDKVDKHNSKVNEHFDEKMKNSDKYQEYDKIRSYMNSRKNNPDSYKYNSDAFDYDRYAEQEAKKLENKAWKETYKDRKTIENQIRKDNPNMTDKKMVADLVDMTMLDKSEQLAKTYIDNYFKSDTHKQRYSEGVYNYYDTNEKKAINDLDSIAKSYDKKKKKYTVQHSVIQTYGLPDDILMHHGIKGQKWGVRRYQNYDGTLIKAGSMYQKKTKYTNIDGSLNEKGKFHSQKYINKQIAKNNKYYDKQIKKYEKLKAKCGDDKKMQKTFDDMIKDAKRTQKSVNENIKKFGIDQIMANEKEAQTKALKAAGMIAAGSAITATGIGGGLVAAANAGVISAGAAKVGETLMKFDPMTVGDKAIDFVYNDPRGLKAQQYLEGGIRAYADARSYVTGIYVDEAVTRFKQLDEYNHTTDKIADLVGGTGAKAANNFTTNLNAQNQAVVSNLSNPNTIAQLNSLLGATASSSNQLASSFDPAMVASMETLYANPEYAQALTYRK